MVEYNCNCCGYYTIIKTHYMKHLKTKKHLAKEKEHEIKIKEKAPKCTQNAPKMHPEAPSNKICIFCNKSFTRTTGLKKHLKICSYQKTVSNAPKCTQKD